MIIILPMVKVSTLLYLCDNLNYEKEEIFDIDSYFKALEDDYLSIQEYLDNQLFEVRQDIVNEVLAKISHL